MEWNEGKLSAGREPLWLQIAERLRAGIKSGHFAPGEHLPSESELNRLFGVSRTTARAALDKLRNEGLITRQSGKGSIVSSPYVEQPLSSLSSFSEDMAARGLTASYETRAVAMKRAPVEVCEVFGLPSGASLLHIRRRLLADGAVIGLSRCWISPATIKGKTPPTAGELDHRSLYRWLEEECGERICGGTETIEAANAEAKLADALETKAGNAVLIARRRSCNARGRIVEYAVIAYRSDRYRFTLEMSGVR
jgi:GntR family transcriptional regulator